MVSSLLFSDDSSQVLEKLTAIGSIPNMVLDAAQIGGLILCHLKFTILPEGMDESLFMVLGFKLGISPIIPIFPCVQREWTGRQLQSWLKYFPFPADKLSSVEKLDGDLFINGFVEGILTGDDLRIMSKVIEQKYAKMASYITRMKGKNEKEFESICRFLRLDPDVGADRTRCRKALASAFPSNIPSRIFPARSGLSDEQLEDPAYAEGIRSILVDAFQRPMLNFDVEVDRFMDHVRGLVFRPRSTKGEYYAKYFYLGQSSSTGKSRLLLSRKERDDFGVLCVYINAAHKDAKSFPSPTELDGQLVDVMLKAETMAAMDAFIIHLLRQIQDRVCEKRDDGAWILRPGLVPRGYTLEELGFDVAALVQQQGSSCSFASFKNLKIVTQADGREKPLVILVAFDEAYRLIERKVVLDEGGKNITRMNSFRLLRRTLHRYDKQVRNCLFVFSDTNTSLANFAPGKFFDPSYKGGFTETDATQGSFELYPPFLLTETWDVYTLGDDLSKQGIDWHKHVHSDDYKRSLFKWGRPIWYSFLNGCLERSVGLGDAISACLDFARQKLQIHMRSESWEEKVSSAVACVSLTAGIQWYYGSLANSLVKKRMALVIGHSTNTGQIVVMYPPEPALSCSACFKLVEEPDAILQYILASEDFAFASVGDMGEFVVRILVIVANFASIASQATTIDFVQPQSVKGLLEAVFGEAAWLQVEEWARKSDDGAVWRVLDGVTCFSRFTRPFQLAQAIEGQTDSEWLYANYNYALSLHSAICLTRNYPGFDLVVPVVLQDGSLGSINLQVKSVACRLGRNERRKIADRMRSTEFVKLPCINVCLNVYEHSETTTPLFIEDDVVYCDGLGSCFLGLWRRFPELRSVVQSFCSIGRFQRECEKKGMLFKDLPVSSCVQLFYGEEEDQRQSRKGSSAQGAVKRLRIDQP